MGEGMETLDIPPDMDDVSHDEGEARSLLLPTSSHSNSGSNSWVSPLLPHYGAWLVSMIVMSCLMASWLILRSWLWNGDGDIDGSGTSVSAADVSLAQSIDGSILPVRCRIYTYFQPVPELNIDEQAVKLQLWAAWYYSRGWFPVVLNANDAQQLPNASELEKAFRSLPSVNPKEYEVSCYMRWLAVAVKGGLFLDYDIFDLSITPAFPELDPRSRCEYGQLTSYENHYPMLTHGNATELIKWVHYLANYQLEEDDKYDGRWHISDMHIAQRLKAANGLFERRPAVPWYHFSHAAIHFTEAYASPTVFTARMLQLQFLVENPLRAVGRAGQLIGEALALCLPDEYTAISENFCFFDYNNRSTAYDWRHGLCSSISGKPWKSSQFTCRLRDRKQAVLDNTQVTSPPSSLQSVPAGANEFVVAVSVNPLVAVLHSMPSLSSLDDDAGLAQWLHSARANPFLLQLTEQQLPVNSSARERWSAAVELVTDARRALLVADEDLPRTAVGLQQLLSRCVGFDLPARTLSELHSQLMNFAAENEAATKAAMELSDVAKQLIRSWHPLDWELHRLIRERHDSQAREWEGLTVHTAARQ